MTTKDIILYIITSLGSLGLVAGSIGYLVNSFRSGSKQEKGDVISSAEQLSQFWKDQAEGYKVMMEAKDIKNAEQINKLTGEVGELKGQLNAETAQKKEYLAILQNRDPETKKFMEFMIEATTTQTAINKETISILKEIHQMITEERDKELHIDATLTKHNV